MPARRATLALGGGGARGIAHLGVIEELVRADLAFDRIVGVSIGAVVGAHFAFRPDIARVQREAGELMSSPEFRRHQQHLFRTQFSRLPDSAGSVVTRYRRLADSLRANRMLYRAVRRSSLMPGALLEHVVEQLLPDADIADAAIPLTVVAVDLHTGRPVVFDRGPVRLAVRFGFGAGDLSPVPFEDKLLCDVGGFAALPLEVARSLDPDLLIAVDVGTDLKPLAREPSAVEILLRMNDIGAELFRDHVKSEADLVILPDVGHVEWFDFTSAGEMIAAGRTAAREALAGFSPSRNWLQRLLGRGR